MSFLAAAINDDASYAAGITTALSDKSSLSSANTFTVGPQTINTGSSVNNGLIIKGAVSQNSGGALTLWQNNLSSTLAQVTGTGRIYSAVSITAGAISTSLGALTAIPTSAGIIGSVVRGFASQTADLQQWQNSAGTVLASVDKDGYLQTPRLVITNGGNIIDSAGTTPYFGFGSNQIAIYARNAAYKPLIIQGAASQTANLLEFQNSSGTAITYVTASGHITASSAAISTLYSGGQLQSGTMGYFNATTFAPSVSPIVVRGAASQTANLTQWQDSTGTVYAFINPFGQLSIGQSPTIYSNARISINTVGV